MHLKLYFHDSTKPNLLNLHAIILYKNQSFALAHTHTVFFIVILYAFNLFKVDAFIFVITKLKILITNGCDGSYTIYGVHFNKIICAPQT